MAPERTDVGVALRDANGGVAPSSPAVVQQMLHNLYTAPDHNLPPLYYTMQDGRKRCKYTCKVFGVTVKVHCART